MENSKSLTGSEEKKLNEIDEQYTSDIPVVVPNFVEYNKKRGRPSGSSDKLKKLLALASDGGRNAILRMGNEFTPAMITVEPGEDLVEKVWSLGKKDGPYVSIFTATGTISKVELFDDISGDITSLEGELEIVYVKGTNVSDLCMYVANEQNKVYNGIVYGQAIASGRIQVVAGIFGEKKEEKEKQDYPVRIARAVSDRDKL